MCALPRRLSVPPLRHLGQRAPWRASTVRYGSCAPPRAARHHTRLIPWSELIPWSTSAARRPPHAQGHTLQGHLQGACKAIPFPGLQALQSGRPTRITRGLITQGHTNHTTGPHRPYGSHTDHTAAMQDTPRPRLYCGHAYTAAAQATPTATPILRPRRPHPRPRRPHPTLIKGRAGGGRAPRTPPTTGHTRRRPHTTLIHGRGAGRRRACPSSLPSRRRC